MEDPLVTFFFRLNQSQRFQRNHVVLYKLDLFPAQATALYVYGDACQMGRCDFPFRWSSVPVVAAKFLLHFNRADCRVHLNLGMKFFVKGCAQIVQKFTSPRTAIAAVGIKTWIKA